MTHMFIETDDAGFVNKSHIVRVARQWQKADSEYMHDRLIATLYMQSGDSFVRTFVSHEEYEREFLGIIVSASPGWYRVRPIEDDNGEWSTDKDTIIAFLMMPGDEAVPLCGEQFTNCREYTIQSPDGRCANLDGIFSCAEEYIEDYISIKARKAKNASAT